ncbi:uncharacterized protein LOC107015055 isoform X1 [Solanum pennellii]|uniref:Uncharacterized protein LOC107015055 isoform X1 n=2 Tax=Solanum pennellii TaxID=28526 RepID=A0ABM1GGB5_SOLPN|nr:uncharacterized protein LOC107015055 isoform X1 [Solanum pennellii]XP_027770949.1 uncharacterized protein LOC107015055 isoform X1 [Solanum pennellii]
MGKEDQLPFKVGQSAEAQSFENGFRGAWFRCKIQKISCRKGHWNALLEYFDYPDEKLTWTKLYQNPPYNVGKLKEKTQLMLRPQYPLVKVKNEVSNVSSISEATVVVDGNWQAGDLVDWWANGCYWSGHLTKLLGNNEAELALTPPPVGEGALYEVSFKDLRPSLEWSPDFGWTVPTSQDGVRRCAQLIQPVNRVLHSMSKGRTGYSSDLSFSTHSTANLSPASDDTDLAERPPIIDLPKEAAVNTLKKVRRSDICSSSHTADESTKESFFSDKGSGSCTGVDLANTTAGPTENVSYSSCPLKKFRTSDGVQLHSTGSDTTEAAILDLEELVNKIKWLKGLLELGKPMSNVAIPSWKFVEHNASFGNK